jgi:hypothetical protein
MSKVFFALVAASLAVPAFAAPATGADVTKPDKPKKEKKICRHVSTTASRMGDTVCKTASEWEQSRPEDDGEIHREH